MSELTVADVISRVRRCGAAMDGAHDRLVKQVWNGHSRFPVHGEARTRSSAPLAKDLLRGVVADNGPATVRELLRPRC